MKKLVLIACIFSSLSSFSQTIVDSLSSLSFTMKDDVAEKLAVLALENKKNPNIVLLDKGVEAGFYGWKSARAAWTNSLNASFNVNEGNLKKRDTGIANVFYPRYNFNLSVPLGLFFARPKETKRARAEYEGMIASRDIQVTRMKSTIKANYQVYQLNRYLLALQDALMQDEAVLLSQTQQKFESNQVTLETFVNASKRYNGEVAKRITLLKDVNAARLEIETLIGMDLDTALAQVGAKK